MVLILTTIQYPIKVASIIGLWKTNCLIPPIVVELMDVQRYMREGHDSLCLRDFHKDNIILTHYIPSSWWLQLLYGLGQYAIKPGAVAQLLVMTNNITTLGYIYAKRRLNKPPDIFCKISHIGRVIALILSSLAWNAEL